MKKIQILGTGCAKCNQLAANAREAAEMLGETVELEKITTLNDIMKFGCMATPGLAVDGKLLVQGKVLKPDQIVALIQPDKDR